MSGMTDKWGFSKTERLQFGWTAEHDEMAESIMREFNLPRDRHLITQVTLVRMSLRRETADDPRPPRAKRGPPEDFLGGPMS
jgi:hypothetical protein